jgi:hypothetical protein|tara:strand:- start:688 stop:942 length:255 start_codon:yes stop_codon:yes gene_type:complete
MSEHEPKNIIFLEEVIEQKLRKEKEITFYERELTILQAKLDFLRSEIKLTNLIINLVTSEKNLDILNVPSELSRMEYIDKKIKE